MCFHGPVRATADEHVVYSCYYYYIDPAHETAHVFSRAGPGRGQ